MITNAEFGRRVGYHYTMASRVLGGKRTMSLTQLRKTAEVFGGEDHDSQQAFLSELIEEHAKGAEHFGPWLRTRLSSIDLKVETIALGTATVEEKLAAAK